MTRLATALCTFLSFGLVSASGCDSDSSSGSGGVPAAPGVDAGNGGDAAAAMPGVVPPVVSANQILGLSSKGSIVRIGLGADGKDEDLGFPKYNGEEIRTVRAIAAGTGGLYGLDPSRKSGSNVLIINPSGFEARPLGSDVDFRARAPEKEGLGFGGLALYGSGQFGPVVENGIDGVQHEYILRQANSLTDDTQCSTPEDLVFSGGLLAAGSCTSETKPEKNGYWVWEYILGLPGISSEGGTLTDKAMRHRSPERILGLSRAAGGLVAVSAQRNLLALSGDNFVVVRELTTTIIDLE